MSSSCAWTPSPTSSTHTDTELSVCALAQGQEACPKQRTLTANRPGVEGSPHVLLGAGWEGFPERLLVGEWKLGFRAWKPAVCLCVCMPAAQGRTSSLPAYLCECLHISPPNGWVEGQSYVLPAGPISAAVVSKATSRGVGGGSLPSQGRWTSSHTAPAQARAAAEGRAFTCFCGRREFHLSVPIGTDRPFKAVHRKSNLPEHYLKTQTLHSVAKTEDRGFSLHSDADVREGPQ